MDRSRRGVRETYDRIAEHFARTREYPWPEIPAFLDDAPDVAAGVDVGCGNGRHLPELARRADRALGVDASPPLLAVARRRLAAGHYRDGEDGSDGAGAGDGGGTDGSGAAGTDADDGSDGDGGGGRGGDDRGDGHPWTLPDRYGLVAGDATALPFPADAFGLGLYVATVHHLPDRASRRASLAELARVLRPGGRALVSAWSVDHDRFDRESAFDTTVDWTLPGGETVPRFYHVYDRGEFRADLAATPLAVESAFVASGNCYAEVRAPDG